MYVLESHHKDGGLCSCMNVDSWSSHDQVCFQVERSADTPIVLNRVSISLILFSSFQQNCTRLHSLSVATLATIDAYRYSSLHFFLLLWGKASMLSKRECKITYLYVWRPDQILWCYNELIIGIQWGKWEWILNSPQNYSYTLNPLSSLLL